APASLLVGLGPPSVALRGRRAVASAMERMDDFVLDATLDPRRALPRVEPADELAAFVQRSMVDTYTTADRLVEVTRGVDGGRYPGSGLAGRLQLVSRLLKVGFGARVF